MADNINISFGEIANALKSLAQDHILGVAADIYDENLGKYQSEINAGITDTKVTSVGNHYKPNNTDQTKASGLYKITTDAAGHVTNAVAVVKSDITGLGIPGSDTKYTHPTSAAGAKVSGLYKITTDANGHVTGAVAVAKSDITGLGIPGSDTVYTHPSAGKNTGSFGVPTNSSVDHGDSLLIPYITVDSNGHVTAASNVTVTLPSQYTLPLASSSTRGGIEIGYSENNKNYAVKLSGNKAYVNVPWTDTTYSNATISKAGLMSTTDKLKLDNIVAATNSEIDGLF